VFKAWAALFSILFFLVLHTDQLLKSASFFPVPQALWN